MVIKDPFLVRTPTGFSPHQQIWDAIPDALLVMDGEGLVRYANPAAARIFGHDTAALLARPLESLHRDGHEFPLEITRFDLDIAGERMVGLILRDGSERQLAQATQEALRKISEAAHSAPDLQGLFRQIHSIISELLPARNFYVALYDSVSDLVTFPYWVDEADPVPEPRPMAKLRGLTEVVLRTGEPLLLFRGVAGSPSLDAYQMALIGTDGVDWLGIPLKTARGTIGVLTVQNYTGSVRYTEKHKQLLQFVSDQVAAAVERTQAQQSLLQSEQRFRSVFDHSPIIIGLLSYPEGIFNEMNAAGLDAFGFSREEVMGKSSTQLNVWVDLAERQRYLELLLRDGSVRNFEARMRRRNGDVASPLNPFEFCHRAKVGECRN